MNQIIKLRSVTLRGSWRTKGSDGPRRDDDLLLNLPGTYNCRWKGSSKPGAPWVQRRQGVSDHDGSTADLCPENQIGTTPHTLTRVPCLCT